MSSIEMAESVSAVTEIQNSSELFSRENLVKAGRIAAATVLIAVVPGGIPVAAATGVAWLANRIRSKNTVSEQ